ncbi:MAG: hypothetical protein Q9M39_01595 [Sulfurovum sp.]|nr:hypothetical protein [Sulfurovum sp.]
MFEIYRFLLWVSLVVQVSMAGDNFIVLDSGDDKEKIVEKMKYYEEKTVQILTDGSKVKATIKKVNQSYILRVGPFENNDFLALAYFKAKKYFPNAFMLEKKSFELKVEPVIQTIDKKIYDSLWVGMFSLAFLSIFFMFLSSIQMKRMKLEYQKMKLKHDNLVLRQNEALSIMGENIHNISNKLDPAPLVFEGLNVEVGIGNLNGNIIFYKQMLQEFLDTYAQSSSIFENLVKEQRYGQIKALCLEMRGLTSTIGAKKMYTVINEVQQHIMYKKPELLHSYTTLYKTKLDELVQSINLYLSL